MEINNTTTVSEIVRKNYRTALLFENHNIDFCCGGNISLDHACEKAGLELPKLLSELEKILKKDNPDATYIESLPLDEMCHYIVNKHHKYIMEKTPFIKQKLQKLCEVHGANHPELLEVKEQFEEAASNLIDHMQKEEMILFPYISKLAGVKNRALNNRSESGYAQMIISVMLDEHQTEGDRFKLIAALTNHYTTPHDGCNTYEVTLRMLEEFEKDLHRHIHLENNVLFPKSLELEKELN